MSLDAASADDSISTLVAVAPEQPPRADGSRRPSIIWYFVRTAASICEWVFGAAALLVGLSIVAAIPVIQLLSLGYMLEAGSRVARTGHVTDGFIGVRPAARLGGIVVGAWLVLLPVRLLATFAQSAQLIDPDGPVARRWQAALAAVTILAGFHLLSACLRGGKLRHFLWPFTNPIPVIRRLFHGGYAEARDAVWEFVVACRLPYFFWLGLRAFVGTMIWLIVPITLFALGRKVPLLGFIGAFGLGIVVLYLPFLQMRFAVANRLSALFDLRAVRLAFKRAPLAYAGAIFVTLASAVPLYLLKIEMVPREAAFSSAGRTSAGSSTLRPLRPTAWATAAKLGFFSSHPYRSSEEYVLARTSASHI